MAKESKELNWRWVWLGAAVILVLVFLSVRSLTRERLQVRAVQVSRQSLESTVSTNGRVEPEEPIEVNRTLETPEIRVKTSQAALEAATHNGTQEKKQASAAEMARARLDRDQAQRDLNALT